MARVACQVRIAGSVQGIGFRPWLACTAERLGLSGSARNAGSGALLELEGEEAAIDACLAELRACFASRIETLDRQTCEVRGRMSLAIEASVPAVHASARLPRIPADVPVCDACLDELLDPRSRRHRYPFTHCALCGPRAAVLRDLPYDRERTTLQPFAACAECRREYADRSDRRFHAQTIACAACGPSVTAYAPGAHGERYRAEAAIERAARVLQEGGIVALKGYGGFHLLCDATREASVRELRQRKRRPTRPFAVLLPSLEAAQRCVELGAEAREWLSGARRAVVVAPRARRTRGARLTAWLAPRSRDLGVILPCAPLHYLLLFAPGARPPVDAPRFSALVFTSANASGELPVHASDAARVRLGSLADLIVDHDRAVARPGEDSVVRSSGRTVVPVRLSRAVAPLVLPLPRELGPVPPILALGGDLKCAPALALGHEVLLAEHVGDLACADAVDALEQRVSDLCRIAGVRPAVLACDLHPGYHSSALARAMARPVIEVQHHHAHALAALLDRGPDRAVRPALALVLDGTGWGADGTLWGGELLQVDPWRCERIAHLETVALPGGDAAVREPWRMAAVWLRRAFPEGLPSALPWLRRRDPEALARVLRIAERGLHSPATSSCGRLFDAVASLLDLGDRSGHEGELPMALEALAAVAPGGTELPEEQANADDGFRVPMSLPAADLVRDAVRCRLRGESRARVALRFHRGLANRLASAVVRAARLTGLRRVVICGGCAQNRLLGELLLARLHAADLDAWIPRCIPPGDGGLAIGQAIAAAARTVPHPGRDGRDVCGA